MTRKGLLLLLVVALLVTSAGSVYVFSLSEPSAANAANSTLQTTIPTTGATTPTTEAAKTPQHYRDISGIPLSSFLYFLADYNERYGTSELCSKPLDIPVYYAEDLLYRWTNVWSLHWPAVGRWIYVNHYPSTKGLFSEYPTNALRVRVDGSSYAVYDTETGYRLYIFMDPEKNMIDGWPIVMNKAQVPMLSDFEDIQIGDSIDKVQAVDGVAKIYEDYERRLPGIQSDPVAACKRLMESGDLIYSYHYCRDGILRIEYDNDPTQDGLALIVYNIIIYKDFMVEDYDGTMVNQKICDIDLPTV